jgi:predicted RNA polymerase sigma factor
MVTLNRAVAIAMVHGPADALGLLATLDADERVTGQHRLEAVRAHLLEMVGDRAAALSSYRIAARLTSSLPERRYLEARAASLASRVE